MSQSGDYRRRIAILQPQDQPNGNGGADRTWQTVRGCSSVPAKIVYPPPSKKGDEKYSEQQLHSEVFATMSIRYRPSQNIDASMRIGYGHRIFEILTPVTVDEALQEITMQCKELQGKGTMHS
jgi:SPP1 family predicted phage head-tail adaptor